MTGATQSQTEWARIERALDELLPLAAPERVAALEQLAAGDAALREQLESLLAHADGFDPVLDRPALAEADPAEPAGSLAPGSRLGPYRIVALVGRGGMGEVYRGERADGQYEQAVALKLVRHELAGQSGRFQTERQTLARLEHPGIARLLDGGVAPDGRPYMVVEWIAGKDILAWCAERKCALAERLQLFLAVCDAVAYAHRNLVIHRDLKPANVMVTDDGSVKLLDFGIAKLLGPGDDALTQNAPLTPGYAAPEQLTGQSVTTATDVYALGMLLFELLTGQRPWRLTDLPLVAALDRVLREAPPRPSDFAAQLSTPPVPPRLLRGDLDAIVAKAVRKEPELRYGSVAQMRSDIERTVRHEPVVAREGARLYALGRFLRRYRALAIGTALLMFAILAGASATLWQAHETRLEARRADAVRDFLLGIFQQNSAENPDGELARQTTAEQLLDIGASRIRRELVDQPEVRGQLLNTLADLYDQLEEFDKVAALERERLGELETRDGSRPSDEKATAESGLGRALAMRGDYDQAGALLASAMRTMDAIGDAGSTRRADTLLEQGRIAYHRSRPGDADTARADAAAALAIYEARGPENDNRLYALQLIARIAEAAGHFDEAEARYRAVIVAADQPQYRRDPLLLAHGYEDFGTFLFQRHRLREAEPLLRKSVDLYRRTLGDKRMDTADGEIFLGRVLVAMNRGSEGEPMVRHALASMAETQGEDNLPSTAVDREYLGRVELDRGNFADAATALERDIALLEARSPDNRKLLPLALQADAELLLAEGRYGEAAARLAHAERLWLPERANDGNRHGRNLVLLARLAVYQQHAVENSEAALRQVIATWPASADELPPVYVLATVALAEVHLHGGDPASAESLAKSLLDRLLAAPEREFMADGEARCRSVLGRALLARGAADAAATQLDAAVALRASFDDADSAWLAQARVALATARVAQGRGADSRQLLANAEAVYAKQPTLGEEFTRPVEELRRRLR